MSMNPDERGPNVSAPPQAACPPPQAGTYSPSPQPSVPLKAPGASAPFSIQDILSFNLRDLFQRYKTVLLHPTLATFNAELPAANWAAVLVGAGILAVAWTFFFTVGSLVSGSPYSSGATFGLIVGALLLFFGAFFAAAGIYHLIAKLFGGTASFLTYAYLLSLAIVPTEAIGAVLLIIPILGLLILLATGAYSLYLMALATQSAQRVTQGKAWIIVLIPSAASAVLSCVVPILFAMLLVLIAVGASH